MVIETGLAFFAVGIPAVLLAGISKGGFGSGASFLAVPLMALVLPPEVALGVLLPLLLLIDAVTLRPFWRAWDIRHAGLLLIGAVPGVIAGMVFWQIASADLLRVIIGGIAIAYVLGSAAKAQHPGDGSHTAPRIVGLAAGALAAFTSFVSHAGGPVAAIYLLSQGLSKTAYQATTVLIFGWINVMKTGAYVYLDAITTATFMASLTLVPAALIGAWAGVVAHRVVPERLFFLLTYALLLAAGAKLLFDGLTGLAFSP